MLKNYLFFPLLEFLKKSNPHSSKYKISFLSQIVSLVCNQFSLFGHSNLEMLQYGNFFTSNIWVLKVKLKVNFTIFKKKKAEYILPILKRAECCVFKKKK